MRKVLTVYKNILIHKYTGSNFTYVGKIIFNTEIGAKRHITKTLAHFNGCAKKTWRYYDNI